MIAKEYTNSIINNEDIILIVGENETRNQLNHLIRKNLGLINNGIQIAALKNIDMTETEKKDIKQYQIGNFIKLNNKFYEIEKVNYTSKVFLLNHKNTTEKLLIDLVKINSDYFQLYTSQDLEISTGELIKLRVLSIDR